MALQSARSGLGRANNIRSAYILKVVTLLRAILVGIRNRTIFVAQR